MKEKILRSKDNKDLYLQILDDEFALLDCKEREPITDSPNFAYSMFKILNKAYKLGAFDKVKGTEEDDLDKEEILV